MGARLVSYEPPFFRMSAHFLATVFVTDGPGKS